MTVSRLIDALKNSSEEVEVTVKESEILVPTSLTIATTYVGDEENRVHCAAIDVSDAEGCRKVILLSEVQLEEVLKGLLDARCVLKVE